MYKVFVTLTRLKLSLDPNYINIYIIFCHLFKYEKNIIFIKPDQILHIMASK